MAGRMAGGAVGARELALCSGPLNTRLCTTLGVIQELSLSFEVPRVSLNKPRGRYVPLLTQSWGSGDF